MIVEQSANRLYTVDRPHQSHGRVRFYGSRLLRVYNIELFIFPLLSSTVYYTTYTIFYAIF